MNAEAASVNYIQHLTGVFERMAFDDRLNPSHISMYTALFQMWNISRFQNPFLIIRSEIMQLSKVQSKSTYHRCIRELDSFGYIQYIPSKNASTGSRIKIISFPNANNQRPKNGLPMGQHSPKNELPSAKNGLPVAQHSPKNGLPIEPFNKHINNTKHINYSVGENEFFPTQKTSDKKLKKSSFEIPILEKVVDYFIQKNHSEIEAQRFFNYFESNGWKVGGRTPMKNWKAAANNWMLNVSKFNPIQRPPIPDNLNTNPNKDYSIPL